MHNQIDFLTKEYPLMSDLIKTKEVFWLNPMLSTDKENLKKLPLDLSDVHEASKRLDRFAPFIAACYPETVINGGIIESPIIKIPKMQAYLEAGAKEKIMGNMVLKCDSHLAISGSIKARGGIYEVLKHAETIAFSSGMLSNDDNYEILQNACFHDLFSQHHIAVGSTGNLGLSIGIISAKLGFKVTVHMSADAKAWKKSLLREKGVQVMEYDADYSKAVEEGRKQCENDPNCHFIDDENSKDLFLGYSVAALRLKSQLNQAGIQVDEDHPLFVYLPCGVGGGPGGIAFGMKLVFGEHVHCFFAEPTHSPCMLVGCMTGLHHNISVQDLGIDNVTIADGLAVGRASGFVGKMMENLLSGIYTIDDQRLYKNLAKLADLENILLEPSALAGIMGPLHVSHSKKGKQYILDQGLKSKMDRATHISWATGGSMVPKEEMDQYYQIGASLY